VHRGRKPNPGPGNQHSVRERAAQPFPDEEGVLRDHHAVRVVDDGDLYGSLLHADSFGFRHRPVGATAEHDLVDLEAD
jgi:hypothetical protein